MPLILTKPKDNSAQAKMTAKPTLMTAPKPQHRSLTIKTQVEKVVVEVKEQKTMILEEDQEGKETNEFNTQPSFFFLPDNIQEFEEVEGHHAFPY